MKVDYEVVIVGAGPAGLGAATNAASSGLSHMLFEKAEIGNTIYEYQLRKHVMAEPQKLPLRAHLNFSAGTREQILDDWNRAVKDLGVQVTKAEVRKITKKSSGFEIHYDDKKCSARFVILCIGVQGTPRKLSVDGADLPHVHYRLADPEALKDLDVLIVGAGDAAIENALALHEKNRVSILNLGDDFPRAKEANSSKIMAAIEAGQIKMYANSSLLKIEKEKVIIQTPAGDVTADCNHLIARIGGTLPRKFLEETGVEFSSKDFSAIPIVNGQYESNVKGLFILGALIGYPLIKQAINQGHEVIERIKGHDIEPADQCLIEESLGGLGIPIDEAISKIKSQLHLFKELSDAQFRELLIESKFHRLKSNDIVYEKNAYTDTFFSIIEGKVEIHLDNGKRVSLGGGEFFGEMGLISGRRRSATVSSLDSCILMESPRKQILKLMKSVESVKKNLDQVFLLRALQSSFFRGIDTKILEDLVEKTIPLNFKKSEIIFKQGDLGDRVYFIRKGSVKISFQNATGHSITRTYLPAGHVFGEMAVFSEEESFRTATASAAVSCELIAIEKSNFQRIIKTQEPIRKSIESLIQERQIQNIQEAITEDSGALLDFMMDQGVSDADNVLVIDSNLCVGCDHCEVACAATHDGVSRLDRKGGQSFAHIQIPISCRHCENPLCMTDCPPDALRRMTNGEIVIEDSCIGCGNCEKNCPYSVIKMAYPKTKEKFSLLAWFGFDVQPTKDIKSGAAAKATKCDLCRDLSGGPACVRSCPTGAALRVNASKALKGVKRSDQ
ncbi:MAG: cyclic nucleotide-binding domain-containing protein [Bdellovibrionota bacterium]